MKNRAILVVEEDEALRRSLKGMLLRYGCEIIESSDTSSILGLFQHKSPDLVVLGSSRDRPWDALEMARQIRQWDRRIPLILIANESSEELAIAALKAGVNDYFKRPFSFEELVARINSCLSHLVPRGSSAKYEASAGSIRLTTGSGLTGAERMIGEVPPMRGTKAVWQRVS